VAPQSSKNAPVPDPNSSPVGRKLLEYKGLLKQVLRQQPRPDPTAIHRRDIETPIQDLDRILGGVTSLANRPGIEQFLYSTEAVRINILQARGWLYAALLAYDNIKAEGVSAADKTKFVIELNGTLYECRVLLQVALDQFRF
jgi:hypothetical protein